MTFLSLGLSDDLLKAVEEMGYSEPTPIQAQAIPTVLMGRDVLGIAQTGTGKTASFTLPMLDILGEGRARARMPRSLILEPTRELAHQVSDSFEKYGKYHALTKALIIGGVSFGDQDKVLEKGVDVLIGTPGRLIDQFERSKILLSGVEILVIDEADRMLDMGFIPDIEKICSLLPTRRQTLLFSATMPPPIKRLADRFLDNPKTIEASRPATANASIEQTLIRLMPKDKTRVLKELLAADDVQNAIIFCNRKKDVRTVADVLKKAGLSADQLHGDMEQSERLSVLKSFRENALKFLVASDVAARGLDIPGVSHVINFDVPIHADDYVHRIGRTGRAGRKGKSITLASRSDGDFIEAIQKLIGTTIIAHDGQAQSAPEDEEVPSAGDSPTTEPKRKRSRRKPSRDAADTKAPVADSAQAAPERQAERAPKPSAPPAAPTVKSHERTSTRAADRKGRKPRQSDADSDEQTPSGLGDHVPAFLLVSARTAA